MAMPHTPYNRWQYDLAYGCFTFCGLVALLIGLFTFLPIGFDSAGGFGYLLLIPLTAMSFGAMLLGLIMAARLFRHRPLALLALVSLLFVAEIVTEFGPVLLFNLAPLIYGLVACGFGGAWFFALRKRLRRESGRAG